MRINLPFFGAKKEKVCLFGVNAENLFIAKSAEKANVLFYGSATAADKAALRTWGMPLSPLATPAHSEQQKKPLSTASQPSESHSTLSIRTQISVQFPSISARSSKN